MRKLYHAFYSKKQEEVVRSINKNKNKQGTSKHPCANIYKLHNSNKQVIATTLFGVDEHPNYQDCDIRYNDAKYLGIIDLWISIAYY
tara:strand:+ start:3960 stop:4220 length:261 start_codon:yes stop_codon:yes gene_type:complete